MPQSLVRNVVHVIFSTKNREPFIIPAISDRLFAYLAGTVNELGCHAIKVGGFTDHVHLLFSLSKTLPICKAVEEIKKSSSKWMKANGIPQFYWQGGYGAFSVSFSDEADVAGYIDNQEQHHKTKSFQDEFRDFLRKHGIEWDEKYVWD
jgi:REP element-mobilizing transposase RayT